MDMDIETVNDRVRLVELLDGAGDDRAVAILARLHMLPVPSKSVIALVGKPIARLARRHATAAVAERANALMNKWKAA